MAAASTGMVAVALKHWPLVAVAATALMGFTTLRVDVSNVQEAQKQQVSDHDRIVRMETKQDQLQSDVTEMKKDVKDIAKAVK